MKTLILIFLLLPCAAFAKPDARRAGPVVPEGYTISEADVRATIEHMQRLAQDQQAQLDRQKETIDAHRAIIQRQEEIIGTQEGDLDKAKMATARIRTMAVDIAKQIGALDDELVAEKRGRFWDKVFGWPVATGIGVVVGMFLLPVVKLGFRAGIKAVTGI